jgi:hypothetical protein
MNLNSLYKMLFVKLYIFNLNCHFNIFSLFFIESFIGGPQNKASRLPVWERLFLFLFTVHFTRHI